MKELIFNQFLTFGGCKVVMKKLISNSFFFGEGVAVLKELIFNSSYFGRVWWS